MTATYQSTTVTDFGSDATAHAANMPATVDAGDLLLAVAAFDASATITTPSGWTLLANGFRTDMATGVYAKVADGTEDGTTVDFVTSAAQRGSVHALRFSNWGGSLTTGLRLAVGVPSSNGSSLALSLGASADVHWVVAQTKSSATAWNAGPPSGYSNNSKTNVSEDSISSASIASATRTNTAADETVAALWNSLNSNSFLVAILPEVTTSGTGAITLPFIELSGAGTYGHDATGAITLPFLTVAGVGHMDATATGAITLPFLSVAGVGLMGSQEGTGAITLPFLTVAAAGTLGVEATGAITLSFLVVAGVGHQDPEAAGAITLPFLVVAGEGLYREVGASAGLVTVEVHDAAGAIVAAAMPILIEWETRRALNSIGTWSATIPAIEPLVDGEPLASQIEKGWTFSIIQEGTHPLDRPDLEYLLYKGEVEDKNYGVGEDGQAVCNVKGVFRSNALARRLSPTSAQYAGRTIETIAEEIVDSLAGGITLPADAASRSMTVRFNTDEGGHVLSRYHRLLRVGEYARYALRETWEEDALEMVSIDDPPDSGYYAINAEMAAGNDLPPRGIALIGSVTFRREGRGIVNRVFAFGKDVVYESDQNAETVANLVGHRFGLAVADSEDLGEAQQTKNIPLTLEHATLTSPYTVQHGTNANIYQEATLTIAVQPTAGESFTVGSTTYTFQASGANSAGEVNIGATLALTRANVVAAVNGTDGWNTANALATISAFSNAIATITADNADTALTVSETFASASNTLPAAAYPEGLRDFYYLEDTDSITRHGLVEMVMHRSDISNPNPEDAATTRTQAANVLYQVAALELQRHRFPKLFIEVDIVNGAHVWALPGDTMDVDYVGSAVVS